jgi:hypothetical protein
MREVEIEGEPGTPQGRPEVLRRRSADEHQDRRADRRGQRGVPDADGPDLRRQRGVQHQDQPRHFNNANGIAQLGERGQRNLSMFGGLEPDVFFHGHTIEKIGSDKYRITKGGFTTCVQPTARWEIVSGSATLRLDHYVRMSNAVVEVKDVPVFYLPLLYYPSRKTIARPDSCCRCTARRSPPDRRSATRSSGRSIAARTRRFFTTTCSRAATGLGAEYRYILAPQAQGDFRYYWLDEKEAVINGSRVRRGRVPRCAAISVQNLPFGPGGTRSRRLRQRRLGAPDLRSQFYNASNSTPLVRGRAFRGLAQLSTNGPVRPLETFSDSTNSTVSGAMSPGFQAALSGRAGGPAADLRQLHLPKPGHNMFIREVRTFELDRI